MKTSEEQIFEKYEGKLFKTRIILSGMKKLKNGVGEIVMIAKFEVVGKKTYFTLITKHGIIKDYFPSLWLDESLTACFSFI
jgi:cyclopropane fatty-acyl-phospholipid synthase-like methyltransferase